MAKAISGQIRRITNSDNLTHRKSPPHNGEGRDGDILFAIDVDGVNKLYGKINKDWYVFGNGKKVGYRGYTQTAEAAGDEHVRDILVDRILTIGRSTLKSTVNTADGKTTKDYLNIDSAFFTLASSSTISRISINSISLQDWTSDSSNIGIPGGSNQSAKKLLIFGGDSTGGSSAGGNLYLRAGNSAGGNRGSIYIGHNGSSIINPLTTNIYGSTINVDSAGDIELNADGGDITFKDDSASLATINGDGLTINNIGADSAGDNYLVEVSGLVKKRTPAEVRSDIGAGTSSVAALNDLSDVTYSGGDLTISSLDTIISGALLIDSSGDITLDAGGADIQIDRGGVNFGSINTTTSQKLKILGASNHQVELATTGTGDIVLTSGDDITIDAADKLTIDTDGTFVMMKDSTEFSATNSAYAGMILGYTRIQDNSTTPGTDYVTINSSAMTVLQTVGGTDLSIQFTVPPSGNVEIECRFWVSASSDGAKFSLSTAGTGSSYAELGETHTYDADYTFYIDESDHYVVSVIFAVTGLTAGTDTTYYLAGLASGGSTYIRHGRFRTAGSHSPPIILKAIALPATIVTGE